LAVESGLSARGIRIDGATVAIVVLVLWRVAYHSLYLGEVPFAIATFSDGRQYELSALDLLEHPPLGSKPFYLQGVYAYFMAIPMAIEPWVTFALIAQLLLAGGTLWLFYRVAVHELGGSLGRWATVVVLAYPMLAFYENKFLTAELTVCASVLILAAISWARRRHGAWPLVGLGAALGFGVLARPNFALVVPFAVWAVVVLARSRGRTLARDLGAFALGLALLLAPMALRNAVVTGQTTVFPAHGGGTSFYIGNNADARGVWNSAGGMLTGDVSRERDELRDRLGVPATTEAEEAAAIGRALYRRALDEIADEPGRWAWLELRKVWLFVGTDELTQDYDPYGEAEMVPFDQRVGIPFGVMIVLAAIGGAVGWRRAREDPDRWRAVGLVLAGIVVATVAANLLYFTSSQHRLPLCVPAALLVPLSFGWLRDAFVRRRIVALALVALAIGLTFVPRRKVRAPSGQHYYNLGVAWNAADEPSRARKVLDRAVEKLPDHPVVRLERARAAHRVGDLATAHADLDVLDAMPDVPTWIRAAVTEERERLLER
jgi:hypothetical protein